MFIQTLRAPVAGTVFRFSIAGACGTTSVEVRVNDRSIFKRAYTKMLCHAAALIPADTAGRTLTVTASDTLGNHKSLAYEISAADPGPHSMLSSTRPGPAGSGRRTLSR